MSNYNFPRFNEFKLKEYNRLLTVKIDDSLSFLKYSTYDNCYMELLNWLKYHCKLNLPEGSSSTSITSYILPRRILEVDDAPIKALGLYSKNHLLRALLITYPNKDTWVSEALYYQVYAAVAPYSLRYRLGLIDVSKDILNYKDLIIYYQLQNLNKKYHVEEMSEFIKDKKAIQVWSDLQNTLVDIRAFTVNTLKNANLVPIEKGRLTAPSYFISIPEPLTPKKGSNIAVMLDVNLEQMFDIYIEINTADDKKTISQLT